MRKTKGRRDISSLIKRIIIINRITVRKCLEGFEPCVASAKTGMKLNIATVSFSPV